MAAPEAILDEDDLLALLVPAESDLEDFRARLETACEAVVRQAAEATQAKAKEVAEQAVAKASGPEPAVIAVHMDALSGSYPALCALLAETGMERYAGVFVEEGYDTEAALKLATDDDLAELGVKAGHRRVLMAAIGDMLGK